VLPAASQFLAIVPFKSVLGIYPFIHANHHHPKKRIKIGGD
jgi:hypothetical protein